MFSRVATTFLCTSVAFAALAVATPNPAMMKRWAAPTTAPVVTKTVTATAPASTVTSTSAGSCNSGPAQCCGSTKPASDPAVKSLLDILGIPLTGLESLLVGFDCSPVNVLKQGGGTACGTSPVCCENNSNGGLVSVGCIPITF